ncbi:hypothetical protein TB2_001485 [Malus domestica]
MAFITDALGTKPTTGAIILGLVIPNRPPLGLNVNVYSIHDWESFSKLQVLIVESYVTKFLGVTLAAMCCKIKFKHSLLLSMIMSIKGLIEPSIYSRWRVLKVSYSFLYLFPPSL